MIQINNLQDFFKYVKKESFMVDGSGINPKAGFNHRYTGKDTNGNDAGLTAEDERAIDTAMDGFIVQVLKFRDKREAARGIL